MRSRLIEFFFGLEFGPFCERRRCNFQFISYCCGDTIEMAEIIHNNSNVQNSTKLWKIQLHDHFYYIVTIHWKQIDKRTKICL